MKSINKISTSLLIAVALTACGNSEPSNKDVHNAISARMKQEITNMPMMDADDLVINKIEKVACQKSEDASGFNCDVEIDMSVNMPVVGTQQQKGVEQFRFVKTDSGWSVTEA